MSRRKKQANITRNKPRPQGIVTAPAQGVPPAPNVANGPWGRYWPVAVLVLVVAGCVLFTAWKNQVWPFAITEQKEEKKEPQEKPAPEHALTKAIREMHKSGAFRPDPPAVVPPDMKPESQDDKLVARFVKLKNAGDKTAVTLLGGTALEDGETILEKEFAARAVDSFLRMKLPIKAIWHGEPDGKGDQKTTANRYTLACKGNVITPRVFVVEDGKKAGMQQNITNPELVIEVRAGKIHGVKAELAR